MMLKLCTVALVCFLGIGTAISGAGLYARDIATIDRTGSIFVAPKFGISYPMGALADANYDRIYASWRKEGITLTGEVGYYATNSSIIGFEASYSDFHPRHIGVFPNGVDESRVRVRRFGVYFQYLLVPSGRYRPFLKAGAGLFEVSRISMPQPGTDPVEYRDYTLGAKPVFSGGLGINASLNSGLGLSLSVEAVSLNSFSAAWETSGETIGPLRKNMLFFPVYFGLSFHLN